MAAIFAPFSFAANFSSAFAADNDLRIRSALSLALQLAARWSLYRPQKSFGFYLYRLQGSLKPCEYCCLLIHMLFSFGVREISGELWLIRPWLTNSVGYFVITCELYAWPVLTSRRHVVVRQNVVQPDWVRMSLPAIVRPFNLSARD